MIAAGLEYGIQIQAIDSERGKVIQLFQDSLQRAAKEIIIQHVPFGIPYVCGRIFPAAVQDGTLFAQEPLSRYRTPVEPVRKNLVENGVLQPVRRRRPGIIHRDLERRRFFPRGIPAAAALLRIVPVINSSAARPDDEIVPYEAAFFRHRKSDSIAALLYGLLRQHAGGPGAPGTSPAGNLRLLTGHGQTFFSVVDPKTQKNSFRSVTLHVQVQADFRAGRHGPEGETVSCIA